MNRFYVLITILLLCACLASCARTPVNPDMSEPETPEPPSMHEVESMLEPLEAFVIDGAASESDANAVPESSVFGQEDAQPSLNAAQPAADAVRHEPAPTQTPEASSSVSEIIPAVSMEKRLDYEIIERELLRLINEERESVGVEPLGVEENMLFAARIRAGETISSFSHTRPNGTPYNTSFDEAGFSYAGKWHGENLASLSFTSGTFDEKSAALEMFNGLKSSPGHYRNMVSENFLQAGIGVAIAFGPDETDIASAQLFSSL